MTNQMSGSTAAHGVVASQARGIRILKAFPGFFYILLLYAGGYFLVDNPRAPLFTIVDYHLSWVEVLLVAASIMAIFELLRVSLPGIDNTIEAIFMLGITVVQLVLWVLGFAGVDGFSIFNNTEFLNLLLISAAQTVVAFIINARTLKRTISTGGGLDE